MSEPLWTATIKDDVSAVSSKMAFSLKALDTTASSLFVKSQGNFKKFGQDLKKAGVDANDARMVVAKYRKELDDTRREMLGLGKAAQTTWQQMRSAFREASSMRQVAIGFARGMGDRASSIPGAMLAAPFKALTAGFDVVTSIGEKVAGATADLMGAVVDAAQFRQNALSGLEYMLGSRKAAVDIFADAQKLATETPLDTDKVISGIKQLVTAGFSGDESKVLFKAVADQASKFADDAGMQDKVIQAFSRVKGRGMATGEDLESFRVAGFRSESIAQSLLENENLAPLFKKIKVGGIAGGKTRYVSRDKADPESIMATVKEVLGSGKIGTYTFLNAAIKSLERDKPNLGEFAKKMGKVSLTGTISNFKGAFGDLLKSTDVQSWKGIEAFQRFLTRITEAMSPASETGKRLLSVFQGITDSLLGGLDSIGEADIESFIGKIESMARSLIDMIKNAWGWLDRLLHGGDIGDDLSDVLVDVAKYIGAGIWEGIKNAGDILKSKETEKSLKFADTTGGISKDFVEQKAAMLGMKPKDLARSLRQAKNDFYAAGGAVDFGGGLSSDEALFRAFAPHMKNGLMEDKPSAAETAARSQGLDIWAKGPGSNLYEIGNYVGEQAGAGFEEGASQRLEIHSPSRTMARIGEMAAQGLMDGTEKGAAAAPAQQAGASGPLVEIGQINVGGAFSDPEAAGQAISRVIEREVIALFQRKALEG